MRVLYFSSSMNCPSHLREWNRIKQSIPQLKLVDKPARADVIIFYACAMTKDEIALAREKLAEFVEAKRKKPALKLLVGGCALEMLEGLDSEFPEIDATFSRQSMAEVVLRALGLPENTAKPAVEIYGGGIAAIPIATGCRKGCAFCKRAYLEMPLTSTPKYQILDELEEAVHVRGVRHVNLTGENATEWGVDLYGEPRLLELLEKVLAEFPEIQTLDICGVTLDEVTPELLRFLVKERKVGQIQIEAQSFIPAVRKAMHLTATADRARQIIERLSLAKPIISNVMVGHPGETEADFLAEMAYIRRHGLYMLDPNIFVCTPGTPSAEMEQIPDDVKMRRLEMFSFLSLQLREKRMFELAKLGRSGHLFSAHVIADSLEGALLMLDDESVTVGVEQNLPVGERVKCRILAPGIPADGHNMVRMYGTVV